VRTTRPPGGGRGFLDRLRARRERAREVEAELVAAEERGIEAPPATEAPAPRRPRHVRAVPTNADLKMERALELFNGSDHPRTVGGVARSLGQPAVCVRPTPERPSVVSITVMWDLSWYRYEVDLTDEGAGPRRVGQGDELEELAPEDTVGNATADERGHLHLPAAA
jgi:hypothetical protein